ncbi:sulfatase-like hydrolase/transferase [Aeoliella sp. ICT_H6.2]|uniref:Sulfatase-like hydrolase/transferase n=1 Tax=Aeoliella straminimaris TaxID=2954799 RepID=A0A9X2JHJ5_9BACT|nr:sulfatase-like hydrolase/transferase [Aeoliella straminimaris]MCO6045881.1 sulfatase-like hydrolase/transferase [Aeoliella straminimaris]
MTSQFAFFKPMGQITLRAFSITVIATVQFAFIQVQADDTPPNIIMILADDQSWNGTSVRMIPDDPRSASDFYQTPNLEALAAGGMRFSDAYSAASICSPTRSALLTGRSPGQLSVTDIVHPAGVRSFAPLPLVPVEWRSLDTSFETLPMRVKGGNANYVTGHIGKWHMEPDAPLLMGYDYFDFASRDPEIGKEDPGSVFTRTEAAVSFIDDRVASSEPFFLSLAHFAVHEPIEGQASVIEKYEAMEPGSIHKSATYAAFTEALDTAVGQLIDHVDSLGLSDNTYIIYASDNGAANRYSLNTPLNGQKQHLMEGGIRTPLIISGPGIAANSLSRTPVTTVDLYATISDLAGNSSEFQEGIEGASLRPLLENNGELPAGVEFLERQYSENGAIFFAQPQNMGISANYRVRPMYAVRAGDYKLLRIQGENGNPDRDYLFDLSATFTETETSSSVDLSASNPAKTAELAQLLDNWIQDADVSLAYDVAKPTEIVWRGDQLGNNADTWRAVTDIDHRWRESFEKVDDADLPQQVSVQSHLVNAPARAIEFTGDDGLGRRFFHVGERTERCCGDRFPSGEADFDHSVTFEALVRLDDMTQDHMLFETGTTGQGLSLTIGDADGDGTHSDVRFRVVSSLGDQLEVTGKLDQFASPTRDFVLISSVISDDPNDRYIELFVNGSSIGRTDGVSGDTMLLWDQYLKGFDVARLGSSAAGSMGGNSGAGALPFTGGSLRGELGYFRFSNLASTPAEIQESYSALLASPAYGVSTTTGVVDIPTSRPVSVASGDFELDGSIRLLHERVGEFEGQGIVDVVATRDAEVILGAGSQGGNNVLHAGTRYASYLVHYDGSDGAQGDVSLVGSMSFDVPIVGLLFEESSLDATDLLFGVAGRFDTGDRSLLNNGEGVFRISEDLRTLEFDMTIDADMLTQLRILTLAVPMLAGDFNNDGYVDTSDYQLWRTEFGSATASSADGNLDGRVDIADYTIWRNNLGASLQAPNAGSNSVPEPTGVLLAVGFAFCLLRTLRPTSLQLNMAA